MFAFSESFGRHSLKHGRINGCTKNKTVFKGNNNGQDSSRLQVHKHVNELAGGKIGSSHKAVLELGKWID